MNKILIIFIFIFVSSCSKVDFIYSNNDELTNPLYERTNVTTIGINLAYLNSYIPVVFGNNKENSYNLLIEITETKTRSSVETNQAASNLRYVLRFKYTLISIEQDCEVFYKEIISYFNIIPKSDGYNFGTDTSLEKKYELVIADNLSQFVSLISIDKVDSCK
tara:strand:+ start:56 stop:544 length:489 start_codon:yes stop_codon:yes gene_type:complete